MSSIRPGSARLDGLRLGIAHHFGWAVAVTASADHPVVDRRRIELVEPGVASAPMHHEGQAARRRRASRRSSPRCGRRRCEQHRRRSTRLARPGGTDRVDVAAGVAPRLPRRHRRATARAVRVPRRLGHVPPGAGRARTGTRLGRPRLRRRGGGGPRGRDPGRAGRRGAAGSVGDVGPPWSKDHRMALAATILAVRDGQQGSSSSCNRCAYHPSAWGSA